MNGTAIVALLPALIVRRVVNGWVIEPYSDFQRGGPNILDPQVYVFNVWADVSAHLAERLALEPKT